MAREVRENASAWPYSPDKHRTIRIVHKGIARNPGVVRSVIVVGKTRNMQVGDRNDAEVLGFHVAHQLRHVWKLLWIYGERAIFVLIIDVEPQNVARNAIATHPARDVAHLCFRRVAVPALLKAERP